MPDALVIGVSPKTAEDAAAPEADAGELATEAFGKALRAGDSAAAWSAFLDMCAAAKQQGHGEPDADDSMPY
jgi:hypothetical protein